MNDSPRFDCVRPRWFRLAESPARRSEPLAIEACNVGPYSRGVRVISQNQGCGGRRQTGKSGWRIRDVRYLFAGEYTPHNGSPQHEGSIIPARSI